MNILYRGSLSSCNYSCTYCPFAKTRNTRAELRRDFAELRRFADWVAQHSEPKAILFTPWGEALGHRTYRQTLVELSHLPHVRRVAIQTNLSAPTADLAAANRAVLALWTTFHPTQTTCAEFLQRCHQLDHHGIRYSVGVVGLREHFAAIEELRRQLPPRVYLWINAFKRQPDYYTAEEVTRLLGTDPHFHFNLHRYPSRGKACLAGQSSFTVDGNGDVRRCHFVPDVIGNIYAGDLNLRPRPCSADSCGCHIGYIHMPELRQYELYGDGLMERIPAGWPS